MPDYDSRWEEGRDDEDPRVYVLSEASDADLIEARGCADRSGADTWVAVYDSDGNLVSVHDDYGTAVYARGITLDEAERVVDACGCSEMDPCRTEYRAVEGSVTNALAGCVTGWIILVELDLDA